MNEQTGDAETDFARGHRLLAIAIIAQAFVDLTDPEERADAEEFLTRTFWEPEAELEPGIPFRHILPNMFTESARAAVVGRVQAVKAGGRLGAIAELFA